MAVTDSAEPLAALGTVIGIERPAVAAVPDHQVGPLLDTGPLRDVEVAVAVTVHVPGTDGDAVADGARVAQDVPVPRRRWIRSWNGVTSTMSGRRSPSMSATMASTAWRLAMPDVLVTSTSRPLSLRRMPEAVAGRPVHGAFAEHDVLPAVRSRSAGRRQSAPPAASNPPRTGHISVARRVGEHAVEGWQPVRSRRAVGKEQVGVLVVVEVEEHRQATSTHYPGRASQVRSPRAAIGAVRP